MGLDNDARRDNKGPTNDAPSLTGHHKRRRWQRKLRKNTNERGETIEKYGVINIKRKNHSRKA